MTDLPPLRVLVVEDDPLVLISLRQTLEAIGIEVAETAISAEKGLALARGADIDFAVLDVLLGKDASFDISEELERRDIPFIYVTGYPNRIDLDGQFRAISVEKPFDEEQLETAIALCLSRRAERGSPRRNPLRSILAYLTRDS